MRNAIKKNKKSLALSAVAAAGLSAWAGAPVAHGAFVVNPINLGNSTISGVTYTTWVFTATGDATSGTLMATGDVETTVPASQAGAIAIDIEVASGTGSNTKYTANVDGSLTPSDTGEDTTQGAPLASQNAGASVYGDPGAGTFGGWGYDVPVGVGVAANFNATDQVDNPFITQGAGSTAFVYTNNQTAVLPFPSNAGGSSGGTAAVFSSAKLTGTSHLDSAFETSASKVSAGTNNNGSQLFSLETNFAAFNGSSTTFQPSYVGDAAPFFQVVVKQGTVFTFAGELDTSTSVNDFNTVIGGGSPPPVLTLTFGNSVPGSSNLGATFAMTGLGHGSYNLQTKGISGAAQTTGYTDVTGFNPATDVEVYGLAIDSNGSLATGSTLTSIVASLEASLQSTDTNWNITALPPGPSGVGSSAVSILEAAGNNAEVVLPDVTDDAYLSWNLSSLPGVTITSVSVVPEPTSIAAIVLGGSALLARKRRRKA